MNGETTGQVAASAEKKRGKRKNSNGNGNGNGHAVTDSPELALILEKLLSVRNGDFSVRLPVVWDGMAGRIAETFNEIVSGNQQMAMELKRLGQSVGKEGKIRERVRFHMPHGSWGEMEGSVNTLTEDLLRPITEVTRAIAAVAQGNLTQTVRMEVDNRPLEGEFLRSANIVNKMIQQLSVFTAEVTRVAREVGTDGKLGGQAVVPGVAGTWKDLTDSVNLMASNLTGQVRNMAEVATAVASGDLSRKDYRRCARRNFAVERSHQHDGGPVAVVRIGSHARRPRSRHRRKTGWPGCRPWRRRNLEGFDRLCKRHGRKPDGSSAKHC